MGHSSRTAILHLASLPLPYAESWAWQRRVLEDRMAERQHDTLILLEHEPVFTLGRGSKQAHLKRTPETLRRQGYAVHEIERGGAVTYHGPGQMVGYPILRLRNYCAGPKTYVEMLEEVIIRILLEWGIQGRRIAKWRGVWVGESEASLAKIAAVGVRITRGITMHGFALNVNVDLTPFDWITPCGIEECRITSLAKERGAMVDLGVVMKQAADHFAQVFNIHWMPGSLQPKCPIPRSDAGWLR